ncbi:hypothetical protein PIB30_037823 [Stylosanthes scabra]|uniref:Uncharacterized protein n=1 Tax=Stylosanthes scabra TaxID=79078 RepID=A0ABU6REJ7_9FABA|nr:hypothetical protein [Stylosanthes scabra]
MAPVNIGSIYRVARHNLLKCALKPRLFSPIKKSWEVEMGLWSRRHLALLSSPYLMGLAAARPTMALHRRGPATARPTMGKI